MDIPSAPLIVVLAASALGFLSLHAGASSGAWPWGLVFLVVALATAYARGIVNVPGDSAIGRLLASLTASPTSDASGSPGRVVDALGEGHFAPPEVKEFMPDLYTVQRLDKKHAWLRGDAPMARALLHLRTYRLTDGPTVRRILGLLGEFYRRYDRLLNRPWTVHVANEYTVMHDIALAALNTIHELTFSRPPMLNRGIDVVTREVMSRTSRMQRALRHKYPDELKGHALAVAGSAPRAYDPVPPSSPSHPHYAVFV